MAFSGASWILFRIMYINWATKNRIKFVKISGVVEEENKLQMTVKFAANLVIIEAKYIKYNLSSR